MNILDQSIDRAGGVSALARALDLEPNVVSNWRSRGIPDGWAKALMLMRAHADGVFAVHNTNVTELDQSIGALAHVSTDPSSSL